jgi:hypothetical protein
MILGVTKQLTPWSRILLEKLKVLSVTQEIFRLLWNPKAHYRVPRIPPPVAILSHIKPIYTPNRISLRSIFRCSSRSSVREEHFMGPSMSVWLSNFSCEVSNLQSKVNFAQQWEPIVIANHIVMVFLLLFLFPGTASPSWTPFASNISG